MLTLALMPGFPVAQAGDTLKVMAVDTRKIYRETVVLEQLEDELKSKRSIFPDALRDKQTEPRVADRDLAAQPSLLFAEEFFQRRGALEQRMFMLQWELQSRKQDIDQRFAKGMERLQAQLPEIDVPVEES